MTQFAIIRVEKLKGGSVDSSCQHCTRQRKTLNADPEKLSENRVVAGEDRPLREIVDEKKRELGKRPRKDAVECLEYFMGASPGFFRDYTKRLDAAKLDTWIDLSVAFLIKEHKKENVLKIVLHLDESEPHLSGHVYPRDPQERLNAKHFTGGRDKLSALQDRYAKAVAIMGLQRGIERSGATHQDVKRIYGMINKEVEISIDAARLPALGYLSMMTEKSRQDYLQKVAEAARNQVIDQVKIISLQAQLFHDERKRRKGLARRCVEFRESNKQLTKHNASLHDQVTTERKAKESLAGRLRGVLLGEVMRAVGWHEGPARGDGSVTYTHPRRDERIRIRGGQAFNDGNQLLARNAVELVTLVVRDEQAKNLTHEGAIIFLSERFGKERATNAAAVCAEDRAKDVLDAHEARTKAYAQRQEQGPQVRQNVERERTRDEPAGRGAFESYADAKEKTR